jgi:hypothetical protein
VSVLGVDLFGQTYDPQHDYSGSAVYDVSGAMGGTVSFSDHGSYQSASLSLSLSAPLTISVSVPTQLLGPLSVKIVLNQIELDLPGAGQPQPPVNIIAGQPQATFATETLFIAGTAQVGAGPATPFSGQFDSSLYSGSTMSFPTPRLGVLTAGGLGGPSTDFFAPYTTDPSSILSRIHLTLGFGVQNLVFAPEPGGLGLGAVALATLGVLLRRRRAGV